MARPKEIDENDLVEKFNKYIDENDEPLIQEFALNYGINRQYIYELANNNELLTDTIKRCIEKQETYLLRNASTNKINPTFAIFRLKQPCFGYKDKTEIDTTLSNKENDTLKVDFSTTKIEDLKKLIKTTENNENE